MRRLSGVSIKDAEGNAHPVKPADIARLGSLPADQAIEAAEAQFGKLGNWVAERVEELKTLEESKFSALENAKKEAGKVAEEWHTKTQEITKSIAPLMEKANAQIEAHSKYGKYFKQVEGDAEFNGKLEKGTNFVDENWGKDARDPSLNNEQREAVIKAHAAIRNRARAFGVLNLTIARHEAEIARLKTELDQFKSSEPKLDGQRPETANGNGQTADPLHRIYDGIEKYARPVA